MNIFVLDRHPTQAAQWLVDKHVMSKMIVESAQILSNCFTAEQLADSSCPRTQTGNVRKHSYPSHSCCKWAKESRENMRWLINHANSMIFERMCRRQKLGMEPADHFSQNFIWWCDNNISKSIAPDVEQTPVVQCMPEEYRGDDPVEAYRRYYKFGKAHLHHWTRHKPFWI